MSLQIVILAAGQGKRMFSKLPKVLHPLAGKSMLAHVIDTAKTLNPDGIHVIVGHGKEQVKAHCKDWPVNWVEQTEQLGTGHALMQALPHIPKESQVMVLYADVPLLQSKTLKDLIHAASPAKPGQKMPLALLVAHMNNPHGLGRIVRNQLGHVQAIVEEKDATEAQRAIDEIYSGICCVQAEALLRWLPELKNNNAQGEYYLTDIIRMAVAEEIPVHTIAVSEAIEVQGVNNRLQLQELERAYQHRLAKALLLQGVMLADAQRIDIRGEIHCGKDVFIDVNSVFSGQVVIGDDCEIGPNCVLNNVTLGKGTRINANSVLDNCEIGECSEIGPFARLRPGTRLGSHCKIGNFVETKNAVFATGSKASHLSYLGDVTLGSQVNVGAGTITCNYDGVNKHQTIIEDGVFIGSGTQLVAPVRLGKDATIGAGSTIRKDAPAHELTLNERKQVTISGWKRPKKIG